MLHVLSASLLPPLPGSHDEPEPGFEYDNVASRHDDSPVCLAPVMLHLTAILEVLELVVLVLEEDPELALLLLDLGHGLQHHLVSIAVRRQWILIIESSLKTSRYPKFIISTCWDL